VNPLISAIGQKIRTLRKGKGLTLAELGSEVGVSPSLLSQLERGGINPSISLLQSISDALDVNIPDLLDVEEGEADEPFLIIQANERKVLTTAGGASFSLLSRYLDVGCEFLSCVYPPGSSTGKGRYTHEGAECILLLDGELEVELGERVCKLKPGDSITFRSDIPHSLNNKSRKNAKLISVNSEPFIFSIK